MTTTQKVPRTTADATDRPSDCSRSSPWAPTPALDRLTVALEVEIGDLRQLGRVLRGYHWRHAQEGDVMAHVRLHVAEDRRLHGFWASVPPELAPLIEEAAAEACIAYTRASLPPGAPVPARDLFAEFAARHRKRALRATRGLRCRPAIVWRRPRQTRCVGERARRQPAKANAPPGSDGDGDPEGEPDPVALRGFVRVERLAVAT